MSTSAARHGGPSEPVVAPKIDAERVLFVCDAGGHLMEAVEVARTHFAHCEQFWHTANTPMSRSLLAGRNVTFSTKRVTPGRLDLAAREGLAALPLLRRLNVDTVVSTGSAYALPWMAAAVLARKQPIFIESAARMFSLSRVGSLVAKIPGVRRGTQDPFRLDGWDVWPNVMTSALSEDRPRRQAPADTPRVVVTVGTFEFPFNRLLARAEEIIPADWHVTWQYGYAKPPHRGDAYATLEFAEMRAAVAAADVVIAHAGVGSVLIAASQGTQLIIVPRRHVFNEMIDDHQVDLVHFLAGREDITPLEQVEHLTLDVVQHHVDRARATAAP
jgi:UDP-N-acetylglucosamine--N-acetylmuramyl-(pentapeptide) pyrophosphoryl-undecaprenol N-acetylglucosamine transferase